MRAVLCVLAVTACTPEYAVDTAPRVDPIDPDAPDKGVETVTVVLPGAIHLMRLPTPDAAFLLHDVTVPTTPFRRDGVVCHPDEPVYVALVHDPFFAWKPVAEAVVAGSWDKAAPEAVWSLEEPLPLEGDAALWLAVAQDVPDADRSPCLVGDRYDSDVADTWVHDATGWTPILGLFQRVVVTTSVLEGSPDP